MSEVVDVRIAEVRRKRVCAVLLLYRRQGGARFREGRFPGNLFPGVAAPAHGATQPVRVVLQVQNGVALGADVATAERVRGIATNGPQFAA